ALFQDHLIAESDFEDAEVALKSALASLNEGTAQVEKAKADVGQATVDLDHTVIRSPVDGVVIARDVDVGQTVAASVQTPVLFSIAADFRHMEVQADVDESDVGEIKEGAPVTFTVAAYPLEPFSGTVSLVRVQPTIERVTQSTQTTSFSPGATTHPAGGPGSIVSYMAVIDVDNPAEEFRPGSAATREIAAAHKDDAIRIPNGALTFRPTDDMLKTTGSAEPRDQDSDTGNHSPPNTAPC